MSMWKFITSEFEEAKLGAAPISVVDAEAPLGLSGALPDGRVEGKAEMGLLVDVVKGTKVTALFSAGACRGTEEAVGAVEAEL